MKRLGDFEQLVLFAILRLDAQAYGVSIRLEIEARANRSVSAGALYTTLGRLERRGLVESTIGTSTAGRGGHPRKYYQLRPAGARALHAITTQLGAMSQGQLPALARLAERGER